ncbi:hypothetical protein EVA_14061 [gut metagenome]|uniref:Uncharacterized protein n=1 Tax=gut metagenome TaxID=749906 RepID=J9FSA1_9ZZZZ
MVLMSANCIGFAVICNVYHDKQIGATDRFLNITLSFPGSKARAFTFYQE